MYRPDALSALGGLQLPDVVEMMEQRRQRKPAQQDPEEIDLELE